MNVTFARKPSKAQIVSAVRKIIALRKGDFSLTWGENEIAINFSVYGWSGHGWIGKVSGQDLADSIKDGSLK